MTAAELNAAVRAECGKVSSEEELHDDDIAREGVFILDRMGERITDRRLRSITSVVDTREYAPNDATVRVTWVYDSDDQGTDEFNFSGYHVDPAFGEADDYYLWPSLYAIKQQRRIKGLPPLQWGWNPVRRKITIDPMPTQAGILYWYESVEKTNWTLEDLPTTFNELVVTGTTWKCLEIVLLTRSALGGIMRSEGMADYPAPSLKPFIDSKRTDFYELLNVKAQLYGAR